MPAKFLQTGAKVQLETLVVMAPFRIKLMALSILLLQHFFTSFLRGFQRYPSIKIKDCITKNQGYLHVYYKTAGSASHSTLSRKQRVTVECNSPILYITGIHFFFLKIEQLNKVSTLEVVQFVRDSAHTIREVCRKANSSVNEAALFSSRSYTFL